MSVVTLVGSSITLETSLGKSVRRFRDEIVNVGRLPLYVGSSTPWIGLRLDEKERDS